MLSELIVFILGVFVGIISGTPTRRDKIKKFIRGMMEDMNDTSAEKAAKTETVLVPLQQTSQP